MESGYSVQVNDRVKEQIEEEEESEEGAGGPGGEIRDGNEEDEEN